MKRTAKAFTLVELLVVIGIITVLIGVLLPTIAKARKCARELRSVSGLRQMMLGYTMYHQANKGSVLLGYPPQRVNGWDLTATDPRTRLTVSSVAADRYPWRLLSYVSNIWEIIHSHDQVPPLPESATDPGAFMKIYVLSLNPTYGINSYFLGGDKNFGGFVNVPLPVGALPNTGKHVVFKSGEVRHSSKMLVFADCQTFNYPGLEGQGMHFLTPPRANGLWWTCDRGKFQLARTDMMGIPKGWYTARTVAAFFDGHVEAMLPDELNDMRYWANWATSPTYDVTP